MPFITKIIDRWTKLSSKEKLEWSIVLLIIVPIAIAPLCSVLSRDKEDSASTTKISSTSTPQVESGCTAEETEYFDVVNPALAGIMIKQTELQEMSTGMSSEPLRILDPEWQGQFHEIIVVIESHANVIMSSSPPQSLVGIHGDLERMSIHLGNMSSMALTGLELLDADMLTKANDEKIKAYRYMERVLAKMENFCL